MSGEKVYGVAIDEGRKHRPETIGCKAEKSGNGFKLSGKKDFVVYGASSEMIVVAARTSGGDRRPDGVTLFAVPQDAAGMSHDSVRLVDSSMASHITFDGVELDGDAVIGEVDGGREVLDAMLVAGRVGSAAEGVGVARGAMDMTVDYLKQRKQFGKVIGEFQALQHRASHLYSEVEIARAVAIKAAQLVDGGSEKADPDGLGCQGEGRQGRRSGSARRRADARRHRNDRRIRHRALHEARSRAAGVPRRPVLPPRVAELSGY